LIPVSLADQARDAYRELRRLQHKLRLQGADVARMEVQQAEQFVSPVRELWQLLEGKGLGAKT
jgi:glutamate-ammonia-ligase adenylyltransferase